MLEMIQLARITNNGIPEYTVYILQDLLNDKMLSDQVYANCGAWGSLQEKCRRSARVPFLKLRGLLDKKGADLAVFDSWVVSENTVQSIYECLDQARSIVIVTEHKDEIDKLANLDFLVLSIEDLVDGRNCLDGESINRQQALYRAIGR